MYNSKISNLIQIWGGVSEAVLKSIQVSQNAAARVVTRQSWFTPTRTLLKQCGWLSVRQLVVYHTALTTHKIVREERPKYLHEKMCAEKNYLTRNDIKFSYNFKAKSERANNSFCYRGATVYNQLPISIKMESNILCFKRKLKEWVMKIFPQHHSP